MVTTSSFCKMKFDLFNFHINRFILEVLLQYFDPCLIIVHVCIRFHFLPIGLKIYVVNFVFQTLGLDNLHSTFNKLYLFSNHPKNKQYPKTCFDVVYPSIYKISSIYSKALHYHCPP